MDIEMAPVHHTDSVGFLPHPRTFDIVYLSMILLC